MKKRKQESTVVVISTKHGLCDKKIWLGEMRKGLGRRRICHLPLFVFFGKNLL